MILMKNTAITYNGVLRYYTSIHNTALFNQGSRSASLNFGGGNL